MELIRRLQKNSKGRVGEIWGKELGGPSAKLPKDCKKLTSSAKMVELGGI